ncbi:MAG: outer membrane beta-barrel protein [Flavobacteriales bacterium]|nr:outer membrane beta-barrel protein [Flavobacteriales bacterium]
MRALLTSILLALLITAQAQTNRIEPGRQLSTLSGGLQVGIPVGEFNTTWGRTLYGLSGNIAFPMRRLPIHFGYDFGWARMGGEEQQSPSSGGIFGGTTGLKVEVNSNVYDHLGLLRIDPSHGKVHPYGDFLIGVRHFSTRSVAHTADENTADEKTSDVVSSMGWAAGVNLTISKNFFADLRVERLYTGRVSYVDVSSIAIAPDGTVTYEKLTSNVDVVNIQLGVGFRF